MTATTIKCPACNCPRTVYHLDWSAILCGACGYEIQNPPPNSATDSAIRRHMERQRSACDPAPEPRHPAACGKCQNPGCPSCFPPTHWSGVIGGADCGHRHESRMRASECARTSGGEGFRWTRGALQGLTEPLWPAPKSKGGRPRSTDPRKLRAVRFSDAEWAEVRRAADATGRSLSEFVRKGASDLAAWEIAKLD